MPDVHVGDVEARLPHAPHRLVDGSPGRAPAHHREPGARLAGLEPLVGDARRDAVDPGRAHVGHALVVVRVVGDVAAVVVLLDSTHPMLEPRRARTHPGTGEGVGVAKVRVEALRVGSERGREGLVAGDVRDPPRLGGTGEVGVAQHDDGSHVTGRDTGRLHRDVEALRGIRRGQHRQRYIRGPAEDGLVKVRLLGLGRHPGGRPGALGVDHDEGKLHRRRVGDRLRLEGHPGAGARGHPEPPRPGSANRGAHGRHLVLRLERRHPELLARGEGVQQVRGGGDRIGRERDREPGELARREQAEGHRLGPVDVAVEAGLRVVPRRHLVGSGLAGKLGRLPEGVPRVQGRDVRVPDGGNAGELGREPVQGRLAFPAVEPHQEAQHPHVLAAHRLLVGEAELDHRLLHVAGDVDLDPAVLRELAVLEGVPVVTRLAQVLRPERARIDNQEPPGVEVRQVGAKGGRVHGDEHVEIVARGGDLAGAEVDLERGNPEQGSGGGADLGREIGKRREIVSVDRGRVGELEPRELHPVARVAREADDDVREHLALAGSLAGPLAGLHKLLRCRHRYRSEIAPHAGARRSRPL